MKQYFNQINLPLLLGDWLTLALITAIGFISHNQQFQIGRFLATAVPVCLAWLVTAPWFGVLSKGERPFLLEWWKVAYAIVLCTPLAILIRGLILNSSIQVTFVLVMIAMCMLGLWIWRFLWSKFIQKHLQSLSGNKINY
jgi:hypothetical protein